MHDYLLMAHGCMGTGSSTGTNHYIVMEDLTTPLEAACVCDLKIGRRGHDDQASTKKVLQQKALCAVTTSSSLGFRMCGMRVRPSVHPPLFTPSHSRAYFSTGEGTS